MRYDQNYGLQNSLGPNKDERVLFADQVLKVTRRLKVERRDFILSVEAFYLVMRANKMGQQFYKVFFFLHVACFRVSLASFFCFGEWHFDEI